MSESNDGTPASLGPATREEIDDHLIQPFINDLRHMSPSMVDAEIRKAENELEEIEPWLEALTAWKRRNDQN